MKEKARRRIMRDLSRRDPRARVVKAQVGPLDGKTAPKQPLEPDLGTAEEESEAEVDLIEHEESRRILGYDE